MIIGINGNEANVKHRVGVGQYAYELLKHFPKEDVVVYLESEPLPDMPKLKYEVFGPKKLWTLTGLQKRLLTNPPDVLFTPTHYAPLFLTMPSVISIMDLGYERFPQYFKKKDLYQLKYWTRLSVRQAKKIITISEFTKQEVIKVYGVQESKVVAIPLAYDAQRFNDKVKKTRNDKYLLFLGTLQPRKNLVRLIEAFSQLEDKELKLVIVGMIKEGRGGWMQEEIFKKAENLKDRVIFTGYLPDEEIPGLMKGAQAFVLPSLYEGFGIPALEAMATGCPVVVSRVSSLPEICGDLAIYIEDPSSVDSIRAALEEVLANGDKKAKLGLEWVTRYNWKDTAEKTLEVLRNV